MKRKDLRVGQLVRTTRAYSSKLGIVLSTEVAAERSQRMYGKPEPTPTAVTPTSWGGRYEFFTGDAISFNTGKNGVLVTTIYFYEPSWNDTVQTVLKDRQWSIEVEQLGRLYPIEGDLENYVQDRIDAQAKAHKAIAQRLADERILVEDHQARFDAATNALFQTTGVRCWYDFDPNKGMLSLKLEEFEKLVKGVVG